MEDRWSFILTDP